MGRNSKTKDRVAVDGDWVGVPVAFLESRACAELSPLGCKMLITMIGQLGANHRGNGRQDAHPDTLRAYGWSSTASARAAIRELIEAGLLVCTRQGRKGRVGLYGVSLFPMACRHDDLDVRPGAWTTRDWRERAGSDARPTVGQPAVWRRPRGAEKHERTPRSGNEMADCNPAVGMNSAASTSCEPAAGAHQALSAGNPFPLRDAPSREAISPGRRWGRMGAILALRCASTSVRHPGYLQARARPCWPIGTPRRVCDATAAP